MSPVVKSVGFELEFSGVYFPQNYERYLLGRRQSRRQYVFNRRQVPMNLYHKRGVGAPDTPRADALYDAAKEHPILRGRVAKETTPGGTELNLGPYFPGSSYDEVRRDAKRAVQAVYELSREHEVALLWSGLHPIEPPYARARQSYSRGAGLGWVGATFAQHVTFDVTPLYEKNPSLLAVLSNQLRNVYPMLVGATCNSPVFLGWNTGNKGVRTLLRRRPPRLGLPPVMDSWAEEISHAALLINLGLARDPGQLWWDWRYKLRVEEIGGNNPLTDKKPFVSVCVRVDEAGEPLILLEIRFMDTPGSPEWAIAITGMLHALIETLCTRLLAGEEMPPVLSSRWVNEGLAEAGGLGLQARLPILVAHPTGSLREHRAENGQVYTMDTAKNLVLGLYESLWPAATRLGCVAELEFMIDKAQQGICPADEEIAALRAADEDIWGFLQWLMLRPVRENWFAE